MNPNFDRKQIAAEAGLTDAEVTLRLIAALPAPEGLAERVQQRLDAAPQTGQVLAWPNARPFGRSWMQHEWVRGAAAAAIAFAVVGGGWGVYSQVKPQQQARVIVMPQRTNGTGFSTAGAIRTPQPVNGPVLVGPALVKPRAHAPATQTPQAAAKTSQ